ncbi:E3 ubiquitin-protein ligase TRIM21 isoform X2 [Oncorhynchus tshawytscha]|uniref:E3 ubiquitin-protein ligase TRIM39-like n=2 Tax=Oncorhynchus tshawytscha TaxID=74940 RepID=A0AAZ3P3P7_ONCTS|nr:E3 ubiquitin-protein ligase TRIM21 isoform X2 [Oncorhynchus tshawytscha]
MASSNSLLSEEQFQCSICLDVFTDPVSIPCGHNFCMACIGVYWNAKGLCKCPMCKKAFEQRPDLSVNTFISEMAAHVRKLAPADSTLKQHPAKPGEVACDVCTGRKFMALKSCLVCLASYCETHLEPHQRVASFKKHKLIDPVENLDDRVCEKHQRPLELFCRSDQTCLCQFCTETGHKFHKTVPIEEESGVRKSLLWETKGKVQRMIKDRLQKVKQMEHSIALRKRGAEREIEDSVHVFTTLVRAIENSQAEFIEEIEVKQKAAERLAEGLIKELEQEITELQRRLTDLQKLSNTEDHLHVLQSSPSLCTLPRTKDWSEIRVHSGLWVGTLRRAVSQLEETLHEEIEKLCETELERMQQSAVDVTLDSDTANPKLILSEDGKQVKLGHRQKLFLDNPKRFDPVPCVLGNEGFTSGRFYFEVQVEGKTRWALGVARESINRKGIVRPSPVNGYWTVGLMNGDEYMAHAGPSVPLSLSEEPQKVGVFVDYEEGEVSFYDVEAGSHIYSFTVCTFTERLYPYLFTGINKDDKNSAPLIICPIMSVNQYEISSLDDAP